MKTKHTQGTWKSIGLEIRHKNSGLILANVYDHNPNNQTKEEMIANAHLIAAAPELFNALQELVYQLTGEQECEEELEKGLGIHLLTKVLVAKAAIKKAIG